MTLPSDCPTKWDHLNPTGAFVTAQQRECLVPSKKKFLGITALFLIVGFWLAVAISESRHTTSDVYEITNRVATQPRASRPWYSGGTLHNTTFGGWIAATPRNRLATAGDWITAVQRREYGRSSSPSGSRLRQLATELRDCVDDATTGAGPEYGLATKSITEASAMCLVLRWGTSPPRP